MPFVGTLDTMPLPDLLQWIGGARKTGTLEVERDRVRKCILFEDGNVIGCTSDDPPERLGQYLLARGLISEEQLREALALQEISGKHLGMMLVEMEAISRDELTDHLEAKAEETIFSLFDWSDAVFRFTEEEIDPAHVFPVTMRVEDVLLRGLKRFDDVQRIREVFHAPGIVLRTTSKPPPRELLDNRIARKLYESVDGHRTVADLLLHVHGSEYAVTKFLFELHENGFVEIAEVRELDPSPAAGSADASPSEPSRLPEGRPVPREAAAEAPVIDRPGPAPAAVRAPAATIETDEDIEALHDLIEGPPAAAPHARPASPHAPQLETVQRLMAEGQLEGAIDLLATLVRDFPGDEILRRMSSQAEAAFIDKAYRHYLPPQKVLSLTRPAEELTSESLSPTEFFMLSRIDGTWDVKSIIQIAPIREVDALRTLKRLRERGVVTLHDP